MKKILSILMVLSLLPIVGCYSTNSKEENSSINITAKLEDSKTSKTSDIDYRSVAYFTSWSAYDRNITFDNVDPNLLTHINFAFANLNTDGEIIVGDSWVDTEKVFSNNNSNNNSFNGLFGQLNDLKKKYPNVKALISVGGWTWSTNFSAVASTESGREKFAQSAVNFIKKYGFDGIDIDWEFPVEGGNNIPHSPNDKSNYTKLIQKTREALDKQGDLDNTHYLLTIAGGPNPSFVKNTELANISKYLDFINVMAYDYHGAWEGKTNHNAPLYSNDLSVSNTIEAYINSGVNPKSLNLGLAFYGRGWNNVTSKSNNGLNQTASAPTSVGYGQGTWEASCFDYWDLQDNYVGKNGYKRYFDNTAKVPYLFNGSVFISYDDEESITAKLNFAKEKELGGVMFWEFSGDKNKNLQTVINNFYKNNPNSSSNYNASNNNNLSITSEVPAEAKNTESNNEINLWNEDSVYIKGDIVNYEEKTFKAKWWTQGETPNTEDEWGPWELVSK